MKSNCKCFICVKKIYKIPSRLSDHPCCSIACRNKYFSGRRSFIWKGGITKDKNIYRAREREKRKSKKEKAVKLLGEKCIKCGYNKSLSALQFHHHNPKDKDYTIKDLMAGSWEKIEKALRKCILVCANCHFEIHNRR